MRNGLLGNVAFINHKAYFVLGKSAKIVFFLLVLSQLFISKDYVKADSFYPSGDSMRCELSQAASLSIRSLPQNSEQPSTYFYDSTQVYGEGSGFVENHTMMDLAELRYPNARRYLGEADNVKVPPNSEIDLGYYYFNYSNHPIFANNLVTFLSSGIGDFTKLVSTNSLSNLNNSNSLNYIFNGGNYLKSGKTISNDLFSNYEISSWTNPPKGIQISSFLVEDPLQIVDKKTN